MEVWTEYEGRTIDGAFPLTRLVRPEGRSAFFTTSNEAGLPRLIRLVEFRSDEDDILSRWRGVAALDHPNILKLEEYGQVVVEETSLLYAVMEPVDANLGEIVRDQRLTVEETRDIAISLASVLDALHSHGFLHQHVQPVNVVAVGEAVKLQCDCIEEAPEGEAGRQLKQRDVHDLAVVLLQALTQEETLEAATSQLPLPAPFDQIVTKGITGEWGLAQIAAALEASTVSETATPAADTPKTHIAARPLPSPLQSAELVQPNLFERDLSPVQSSAPEVAHVSAKREEHETDRPASQRRLVVAVATTLLVLLIITLTWYLVSRRSATPVNPPKVVSAPAADLDAKSSAAAESAATAAPAAPAVSQDKTVNARGQWRVIAFTYRHEAQANKKAATLARRHPELQTAVLRPDGRGPYLVTVGGAMGKDEAFALATKARHEGLPRDTYAQNYKSSNP